MKQLYVLFFLLAGYAYPQDPGRFREEVNAIAHKYDTVWDPARETVVFTGSSSIRFWHSLPGLFPEHQILNTGFGGSHTSDLLAYADELVLRYRPKQVFIYEGDNDINDAEKPREVFRETKQLVKQLRTGNPDLHIVLIAAKPSPVRWHLKNKYIALNRKLKRLCRNKKQLQFADVWSMMLEQGEVRADLFIEDGLHMNEKGYALWHSLIKNFIN